MTRKLSSDLVSEDELCCEKFASDSFLIWLYLLLQFFFLFIILKNSIIL